MVWSRWNGAVLLLLTVAGLAWAQNGLLNRFSSSHINTQDIILVDEPTWPGRMCRVVQRWRTREGCQACKVQCLVTGEYLTIVDLPPNDTPTTGALPHQGRGLLQAFRKRIYHWGRQTTCPPDFPCPPEGWIVDSGALAKGACPTGCENSLRPGSLVSGPSERLVPIPQPGGSMTATPGSPTPGTTSTLGDTTPKVTTVPSTTSPLSSGSPYAPNVAIKPGSLPVTTTTPGTTAVPPPVVTTAPAVPPKPGTTPGTVPPVPTTVTTKPVPTIPAPAATTVTQVPPPPFLPKVSTSPGAPTVVTQQSTPLTTPTTPPLSKLPPGTGSGVSVSATTTPPAPVHTAPTTTAPTTPSSSTFANVKPPPPFIPKVPGPSSSPGGTTTVTQPGNLPAPTTVTTPAPMATSPARPGKLPPFGQATSSTTGIPSMPVGSRPQISPAPVLDGSRWPSAHVTVPRSQATLDDGKVMVPPQVNPYRNVPAPLQREPLAQGNTAAPSSPGINNTAPTQTGTKPDPVPMPGQKTNAPTNQPVAGLPTTAPAQSRPGTVLPAPPSTPASVSKTPINTSPSTSGPAVASQGTHRGGLLQNILGTKPSNSSPATSNKVPAPTVPAHSTGNAATVTQSPGSTTTSGPTKVAQGPAANVIKPAANSPWKAGPPIQQSNQQSTPGAVASRPAPAPSTHYPAPSKPLTKSPTAPATTGIGSTSQIVQSPSQNNPPGLISKAGQPSRLPDPQTLTKPPASGTLVPPSSPATVQTAPTSGGQSMTQLPAGPGRSGPSAVTAPGTVAPVPQVGSSMPNPTTTVCTPPPSDSGSISQLADPTTAPKSSTTAAVPAWRPTGQIQNNIVPPAPGQPTVLAAPQTTETKPATAPPPGVLAELGAQPAFSPASKTSPKAMLPRPGVSSTDSPTSYSQAQPPQTVVPPTVQGNTGNRVPPSNSDGSTNVARLDGSKSNPMADWRRSWGLPEEMSSASQAPAIPRPVVEPRTTKVTGNPGVPVQFPVEYKEVPVPEKNRLTPVPAPATKPVPVEFPVVPPPSRPVPEPASANLATKQPAPPGTEERRPGGWSGLSKLFTSPFVKDDRNTNNQPVSPPPPPTAEKKVVPEKKVLPENKPNDSRWLGGAEAQSSPPPPPTTRVDISGKDVLSDPSSLLSRRAQERLAANDKRTVDALSSEEQNQNPAAKQAFPPTPAVPPSPAPPTGNLPAGSQSVLAANNGLPQAYKMMPVPIVTWPEPATPPGPPPPMLPSPPQPVAFANNAFTPPAPPVGPQQGAFMPNGMPMHPSMNPYLMQQMMMARGMPVHPAVLQQAALLQMPMQQPLPQLPGMPARTYPGPVPPNLVPQQQMPMMPLQQAGYYQPGYPPQGWPHMPYANPAMDRPGVAHAGMPMGATPQANMWQLISSLKASLSPSEREWAANGLVNYDWRNNPQVVPALLTAAREDPAGTVRAACVLNLGRMNIPREMWGHTLEHLRNDVDPRVRQAAEQLLLQYGVTPASTTAVPAPTKS